MTVAESGFVSCSRISFKYCLWSKESARLQGLYKSFITHDKFIFLGFSSNTSTTLEDHYLSP